MNKVYSFSGMVGKVAVILLIGVLAWCYQSIRPLPQNLCGSPGGPPVTAPRIKLRDGRHLAYKEHGVPIESAKHRIIYIHAFSSSRHDAVVITQLSPEVIEELGLYVLAIDKPGYGESDPDPNRTTKSLALDVEEVADKLGLGPRFYVAGHSMGGQAIWGILKYIPHRLAGATLLCPVVNYWWPGFPANLSKAAYYQQLPQDQWALRVAHYAPWLLYWWNTQKLFPASAVIARRLEIFSPQDKQILLKIARRQDLMSMAMQQGIHESLNREMIVGFGSWEFDPMDLQNPFPNNEGSVHLWQGDEDGIVPTILQQYIAKKLPWIKYHELPGAGHMFPYADGMAEAIIKTLLLGEQ
ncbi:uncharacterized protein LOC110807138 isoform X1 [Carica papaya]|uniref:uncharacterized protein LOC110807138 isoform X1 n=2 Tax=Carica papaya TaxID=3649 RepID=UPI000B8C8893|nr:uncharacterized protein LOC110807138 isoform X1 [Carica papaya]